MGKEVEVRRLVYSGTDMTSIRLVEDVIVHSSHVDNGAPVPDFVNANDVCDFMNDGDRANVMFDNITVERYVYTKK